MAGDDCGEVVNRRADGNICYAIRNVALCDCLEGVAWDDCGDVVNRKVDGEIDYAIRDLALCDCLDGVLRCDTGEIINRKSMRIFSLAYGIWHSL